MITIHLNDLFFHSFHGAHEEEALTGGKFRVDASVSFEENSIIRSLDETVNYVSLYNIIKARMAQRYKLLETLAMHIADDMRVSDKKIKKINISIHKLNAPLANFNGNLGITYSKEF